MKNILDSVEKMDNVVDVHLEKQLGDMTGGYGVADIVFPNYQIAVECKSSSADMRKGIGQSMMYESAGYKSALAVPSNRVDGQVFDAVSQTPLCLIGVQRLGDPILYQDIRGGWPFPTEVEGRPPLSDSERYGHCNEILVGGKTNGGWRSEV